jgi:hypothetical protein
MPWLALILTPFVLSFATAGAMAAWAVLFFRPEQAQ